MDKAWFNFEIEKINTKINRYGILVLALCRFYFDIELEAYLSFDYEYEGNAY